MKHILMVDDVATNLKCAAEVFKEHYILSMEKSGEQALKLLKRTTPDLIILDINMPNMSGYEFMEKLRENAEWAEIPVVILTSDSDMDSEIKSLRMGAMDFIRKPFDPEVMLSRIEKILSFENSRKEFSMISSKDALTGVWSRKYFEKEVIKYLSEETDGLFFLLDMDNFKVVNDLHGHIVGDEVLKVYADTLKLFAAEKDILGRIGGDEFALFIKGWYTISEIKDKAQQIVDLLEKNINQMFADEIKITVSLGISLAPGDDSEFMALYHKADKALYFVKQNSRHGYHFYKEKDEILFSENKNEDADLDLLQLKWMIEENSSGIKSNSTENDLYLNLYQFVSRSIARTKQKAQMLLFTVNCEPDYDGNRNFLLEALMKLEDCIAATLRKGDVTTRFSDMQIVAILLDATMENASMIAKRIEVGFCDYKIKNVTVECDIQEIINE